MLLPFKATEEGVIGQYQILKYLRLAIKILSMVQVVQGVHQWKLSQKRT